MNDTGPEMLSDLLMTVYGFAERRCSTQELCSALLDYLDADTVALLRLNGRARRDRVLARVGGIPDDDALLVPVRRLMTANGSSAALVNEGILELTTAESVTQPLLAAFVAARGGCRYVVCVRDNPGNERPDRLSAQLRLLMPHLRQALRLRDAVDEGRAQVAVGVHVLNRAPSAFMVLSVDGEMISANDEARHILDENDGLGGTDGRVLVQHSGLREALAQSLAALGATDDHRTLAVRSVRVERPSGSPPYLVTLLPVVVKGDDTFIVPRRHLLMVVTTSVPRRLPSIEHLRRTFDMTPAEARVCRAMCNGDDTDGVARALGISVTTLKTHLMRVYQNLEVNSRARLIQRLQGYYWVEEPVVVTMPEAGGSPEPVRGP